MSGSSKEEQSLDIMYHTLLDELDAFDKLCPSYKNRIDFIRRALEKTFKDVPNL